MDSIQIHGGVALQGKVCIQGSKNAALPILAATLLTEDTSYIRNCPKIADVYDMIELLRSLGCAVSWEESGIRVNTGQICYGQMPAQAVTSMRSSLCLLGALLGRWGEILMEYPGGCVIGERPIDLHLSALSKMGVEFQDEDGKIHGIARKLHGATICLPFISVGVTENILLAAVMAQGETLIEGAAREPEVVALCEFLQRCGARMEGVGTRRIKVFGGYALHGADYPVPADRIVAGTYLFATIATGGNVFLEKAPYRQMETVLLTAGRMGAQCTASEEGIYVQAREHPLLLTDLRTMPYPGFPTDLQSVALASNTVGEGSCLIEETIFENRFRVVEPLRRMGAHIDILDAGHVRVNGTEGLHGDKVEARELRGGAALVVAGLMAEGKTTVKECHFIHRGYENICKDFRELGARIVSV